MHTKTIIFILMLLIMSSNAKAFTLDSHICADAVGSYPFRALVAVVPSEPLEGEKFTVCIVDAVYPSGVTASLVGDHLSIVVRDDGFSWSPNPIIVVGEEVGPLVGGKYLLDAYIDGSGPIRPVATGIPFTVAPKVVEFYNASLDHYFLTSSAAEASAIDGGSAGVGWIRTGNTFKSGGSTGVCRFYGSVSPGPNSHFYTVDANECNFLKQLQASTPATRKRWNFESLDFFSTPPVNSACPSGTVPVYRAYNNGYAHGVDSSHRITSSFSAIMEVAVRGWINEGVVMCAPN
ncbi:MAG: hypothetical protein K8R50_11710 [Betaproteobacteria bacterium]|nr:hypothetical protein [Betaproteobacteria bacterium]